MTNQTPTLQQAGGPQGASGLFGGIARKAPLAARAGNTRTYFDSADWQMQKEAKDQRAAAPPPDAPVAWRLALPDQDAPGALAAPTHQQGGQELSPIMSKLLSRGITRRPSRLSLCTTTSD